MLAAEGQIHKRQRRVATPAFSIQNMRALVPLVFSKGLQLRDKWNRIISEQRNASHTSETLEPTKLDVCHWVSRATFDVIGSAGRLQITYSQMSMYAFELTILVLGFDYQFNAIENEGNELFNAYKDMFEIAVSQQQQSAYKNILVIYFPIIDKLFVSIVSSFRTSGTHYQLRTQPDDRVKTIQRCQAVIKRVAGQLIQEKKHKILESEKSGAMYQGNDLLSLLRALSSSR